MTVGLNGPLPSTYTGPRLQKQLQPIARALGEYPRAHFGNCVFPSGSLLP